MALEDLYEKLVTNPGRIMRFVSVDGRSVAKDAAEMYADVVAVMTELRSCGVGAGDLVGLFGPNSYEWVVADLALLGLRCVSVAVPMENRIEAGDVQDVIERYGLSAALVTHAVPAGTALPPAAAILQDRPLRLHPIPRPPSGLPENVVTVAFSSGTTGSKKGLMLTDDGIMNTVRVSARAWRVRADDNILVVLPFSNFQQRYLMYLAIWAGCAASVVAPERMFPMLRRLEPTIILGPPSFFELAYNRVSAADPRAKRAYHLAAVLYACAPWGLGRRVRARLGRPWMSMYGPRVRLMLTGSAPVPPLMVRLFQQLGAPLFEIYGSTESGWIAFNLPGRHRIGAAGRPVDGVTVEIAADAEVIVRTAHPQAAGYVMEGTETQDSVFLSGGRIATGDLGRLDGSGFLRLTGRKKNVIITRSGVKINPEPLESAMENGCPISRAVVLAPADDGLLTCVVWLPEDGGPDGGEPDGRVIEVEDYVRRANQRNAPSHRIAEVVFRTAAELTVESGLLTRNLKIDRGAVTRAVFAPIGGRGR